MLFVCSLLTFTHDLILNKMFNFKKQDWFIITYYFLIWTNPVCIHFLSTHVLNSFESRYKNESWWDFIVSVFF